MFQPNVISVIKLSCVSSSYFVAVVFFRTFVKLSPSSMDYILLRKHRSHKVIAGDNVAKQHRMLVCSMTFGDQEAEDNKGRAKYEMVEIEEGRRL